MNGLMFKTLRMKLMLGFLPLLAILIGLGLWAIAMFYGLGGNIVLAVESHERKRLSALMDEPTRCPGEWFGVVATGDLDPGLHLVVHPGGDVRSVGRPPAIAFS